MLSSRPIRRTIWKPGPSVEESTTLPPTTRASLISLPVEADCCRPPVARLQLWYNLVRFLVRFGTIQFGPQGGAKEIQLYLQVVTRGDSPALEVVREEGL